VLREMAVLGGCGRHRGRRRGADRRRHLSVAPDQWRRRSTVRGGLPGSLLRGGPLMRRLMLALVLAAASFGAAGCNDFHYYDVDVTFDTSSGQFAGINEISTIQVMVMGVTGADNGDIQIGPNANGLPLVTGAHLGVFEFATFADSGQ